MGKRTDGNSENFNKELENVKRNELGLKNTIAEVKSTLERRIADYVLSEEHTSDLEIFQIWLEIIQPE